jgi:hypothetical protein
MNTTTTIHTNNRRRGPIATTLIATVAAVISVGTVAAAQSDPPPWNECAYSHYPVAADLGPLVPGDTPVSPEVQAVLLGQVAVGTDCSFYDLPV